MAALTITVEHEPVGPVVAVSGEVDIDTCDQLNQALTDVVAESAEVDVRVDLSDVSFLDSTGLGVLVACRNRAEAVGSRLIVTAPQPQVHRVMAITGLLDILRVDAGTTARSPRAAG